MACHPHLRLHPSMVGPVFRCVLHISFLPFAEELPQALEPASLGLNPGATRHRPGTLQQAFSPPFA